MTVRNAIIGPFLTLFWIASLTPTANAQVDSTREIPVPKYVLWRMYHDLETGRICDSLVNYQHGVIQRAVFVIKKQDSLLTWRYDQIGHLEQEARWWEERYANQVQATKAEKAETKRWKFATIIGGVFIVIITIL